MLCTADPSSLTGQACATPPTPGPSVQLKGAGSSFAYPLISTWASNYNSQHPNVEIAFQSVGSGAGVTDFQQKVVDFAGTDAAPDTITLTSMNSTLTIPETIGAVVLAYNIPGIPTGLHVNETIAARIFNGTGPTGLTYWDDPTIASLNPGISLPHNQIVTVHRADSSGTTFIFEEYLLQAGSSIWNTPQSKAWPNKGVVSGLAGQQNTGVATDVIQTPNSIGYVEVAYALENNMNIAYVQNKDRTSFVKPTLVNITSAVSNANTGSLPTGVQSWSSVSLILEPGANSYPIVGFSYLLVYQQLNVLPLMTLDQAEALVGFLSYAVHDGQSTGASLDYATLPQSIVTIDEASISTMTYNGQSLLPSAQSSGPTSFAFRADLFGSIGWSVEGLSSTVANLNVSHQVSVSIPIGPVSFTPVTESGSFEQSINLSTRVESPGTATAIAQRILSSLQTIGPAGTFSASSPLTSSMTQALLARLNDPSYTEWWVNGPLSSGSPVQILDGQASVTGSENLNLPDVGTKSGWIVTSQVSQLFTVNAPSVPGSGAPGTTLNIASSLNLLWSFDKSNDRLLRSNKSINLAIHNVTTESLGNNCYPACGGTSSTTVTVTRDVNFVLNLAMLLSSINIGSSRGHGSSQSSDLMDMLAGIPWMPLGLAGLAAGAVGGVTVWLTRRTRKAPMLPSSNDSPPPSV